MNYYIINESLNSKIVGIYPQVQDAEYNCNVWEDQNFVDKFNFVKTDFIPKTGNAILRNKANVTDLISAGITGFSLKMLVSEKLKRILEKYRKTGLQFYKSSLITKSQIIEYWLLNPYEFNPEFIDFGKSEIFLMENIFNKVEKLSILNFEELISEKSKIESKGYPYSLFIDKLTLRNDINEDFFMLQNLQGGTKYFVSELLKNEIEKSECTGIEFQPCELTLTEWLQGGHREKVYGKS